MLKHIFKYGFIQRLRRCGYSKKKAVKTYKRFETNFTELGEISLETLVEFAKSNKKESSLFNPDLIAGAFTWAFTPQGFLYWSKVKEDLRDERKY